MKIKVSEATGPALNWLVAKCGAIEPTIEFLYEFWGTSRQRKIPGSVWIHIGERDTEFGGYIIFEPIENWAQGGPIIEQERIQLKHRSYDTDPWWVALIDTPDTSTSKTGCVGPTPLIAAMRCFVASKLGGEVEVPDELP